VSTGEAREREEERGREMISLRTKNTTDDIILDIKREQWDGENSNLMRSLEQ